MEFDKPSTKYLFYVMMAAVVGFFIVGLVMIEREDRARDERNAQYARDCKTLDAKYGEYFTAKYGPFEGVVMHATDFGDRTVGLKVFLSDDNQIRYFRCEDLVRVKDPLK